MSGPSRPRARQETPPDQAGRENQPAGARRGRTLPPAGNLAGTPPLAGNLAGERSQPEATEGSPTDGRWIPMPAPPRCPPPRRPH